MPDLTAPARSGRGAAQLPRAARRRARTARRRAAAMASTPANVRFLLVAALAAALRLALPGAAAQTPALPVPDGTKEGSPGCNSTSHRLARFFFSTPLVLWPAARARCACCPLC